MKKRIFSERGAPGTNFAGFRPAPPTYRITPGKTLKTAGAVVGVLSILSIIDIIGTYPVFSVNREHSIVGYQNFSFPDWQEYEKKPSIAKEARGGEGKGKRRLRSSLMWLIVKVWV